MKVILKLYKLEKQTDSLKLLEKIIYNIVLQNHENVQSRAKYGRVKNQGTRFGV